jgi:D-beta-D-heptose 7-phosphate kinase/D-beta-D-heptose 1-phosphate adenosyltransferase
MDKLLKIVSNLGAPRVLVFGDFMLDSYVYGDALRISPEAPVPVLKVVSREYRCGGAGSVAVDVAGLGGRPICLGVLGDDANGRQLLQLLTAAGADVTGLLTTADRPTISKQRLVGLAQHRHRQQLIRIDEESTEPLPAEEARQLVQLYKDRLPDVDIVCLQDYNKGLLSAELCRQAIELARQGHRKVLVDPAPISDYSKYTGATIITPNRKETSLTVGFEIVGAEDACRACDELMKNLHLEAVVVTLDKQGAYLKTGGTGELVPTIARSVYDVTGAGDVVLAALAVTLAGGCDYRTAVQIANIAGGIEVEKFGAAAVTVDEIINEIISQGRGKTGKIKTVDALLDELNWHREQNNTIVFTNGCFDVLHRGHIEFLKFCRQQGDVVVVGLNSDGSVAALKGLGRPVNNQHDRAAVLAALETVDYVVIFNEPDPLDLIKKVRPNVLVKGQDWAEKGVVGRELVESRGGKVVLAPLVEGKSSTAVIEKIKSFWKKM